MDTPINILRMHRGPLNIVVDIGRAWSLKG